MALFADKIVVLMQRQKNRTEGSETEPHTPGHPHKNKGVTEMQWEEWPFQ